MAKAPALSPRQEKWFASVREGLERETGKSLNAWAKIARKCPHEGHRARLKWLKDEHGLGQNRASAVLDAAFGDLGWDQPDALVDALWPDADQRAIYEAVAKLALKLPETRLTPRKGYTAFVRSFQFAAIKPVKGGGARLGLALAPDVSPLLSPAKAKESWSDRLKAVLELAGAKSVSAQVVALLKAAHDAS